MPLELISKDITTLYCDIIVNAANETLLGGGGVDGCIHRAAGPGLLDECRTLGGCPTGEARITGAYLLPCRYVIHTVGPIWRGGGHGEREKLISCYRESLALAEKHGAHTVAFPLISAGAYGYPKKEALRTAEETITEYLSHSDMLVYLVIFDRLSFPADDGLDRHVKGLIRPIAAECSVPSKTKSPVFRKRCSVFKNETAECAPCDDCLFGASVPAGLTEAVSAMDESFSQMLLRKIDEKGMTDAQCYKKANIDRKLFSKIRSDIHYKPKKQTAAAFALALELSPEEARELLAKAGYSLSQSSIFDIVVSYFIDRGEYDILSVNEALFYYDQSLLGGR